MRSPAKDTDTYRLRLYVAAGTPNSQLAVANLANICRAHLADRFELEVVNVLRHPERALADEIMMTPTLLKLGPGLPCRIVGTLSQTTVVLLALGLELDGTEVGR